MIAAHESDRNEVMIFVALTNFVSEQLEQRSIVVDHGNVTPTIAIKIQNCKATTVSIVIDAGHARNFCKLFSILIQEQAIVFVPAK